MEAFESCMPFIGDGDKQLEETKIIWPKEVVRPLILVTHDESTFSAHDGLKRLWMPIGEQPLRKKGQGRSVRVSDFLTYATGHLELDEEKGNQYPDLPAEACVIINPGVQHDGGGQQKIFTHMFLIKRSQSLRLNFRECKPALFAFDNATSHNAFSLDALRANCMNLSSGGKQPKMRRTT
uniref:Predicted protein putative n=1 Tax=Albugo laibachii Nc14 TaxID=890382 RepID=F0WKW4_9STRA|nr:predicted protein putative [Albugo laibachii Nc14]|eukprot:CCA21923.1 predicted protein putative [Albugo laibachii Nc14]